MVADERAKPPRRTSAWEATGSPVSMCSRTRVARTLLVRSLSDRQISGHNVFAGHHIPGLHYTNSDAGPGH